MPRKGYKQPTSQRVKIALMMRGNRNASGRAVSLKQLANLKQNRKSKTRKRAKEMPECHAQRKRSETAANSVSRGEGTAL